MACWQLSAKQLYKTMLTWTLRNKLKKMSLEMLAIGHFVAALMCSDMFEIYASK